MNNPADPALSSGAEPESPNSADLSALRQALDKCSSQRAEDAREMERIIYAIGHDFREPLRTVTSNAQMLQRQFAADADVMQMTGYMVHAAGQMNGLIEDLLRYWRAGQSPKIHYVNLAGIIRWAVMNLHEDIGQTKAQVIRGEDMPEVAGDETQLTQLFQQLIHNGIRFRRTEPPVIQIVVENKNGECLVTVRDNGTGVEPQYLEDMFVPFKRLHKRGVSGNGLGLAMCQKIVRAHGGVMWAESDGSTGTSVHVSLPLE